MRRPPPAARLPRMLRPKPPPIAACPSSSLRAINTVIPHHARLQPPRPLSANFVCRAVSQHCRLEPSHPYIPLGVMLRAFAASSSSAALTLGTAAYRHTRWVAQSQPCLVRQRRCEQLQAAAAAGPRSMAAAAGAGQDAAVAAAAPPPPPEDTLLQYVVLRRDLWAELEWPLGSVVAQGCHAATAALWQSRDAAATQEYCAPQNIDHMHKARRSRDQSM